MRGTLIQMLILLAVAVVPALATARWHPRSPFFPPDVPPELSSGETAVTQLADDEVSVEQALAWGESVLWIDARSTKEYTKNHIPGAHLLNEQDWEGQLFEVLDAAPLNDPGRVVVYCGSQRCGASRAVADRLRKEAGLERVYVLHGGWDGRTGQE